jgi:uncharacterized protein YcbX
LLLFVNKCKIEASLDMNIRVANLYIYPIKSLGPISLDVAVAEERGFKYDRRWMVVNDKGHFMSQREYPAMAMIDVRMSLGVLHLSSTKNDSEQVRMPAAGALEGEKLEVRVWDDTVMAISPGLEADGWLSELLQQRCRLVYMPDAATRLADRRYATDKTNVSFADSFPFLLTNTASLADLNRRTDTRHPEIHMLRFRPNIVVSCDVPFVEDRWKRIAVGSIHFQLVKPCARCVVTTIEPGTDKKGPEPLRTLARYRKRNNKIYFGQNMIVEGRGRISLGDPVDIIE